MEYLVFLKVGGGLLAALVAAILIWRRKGASSIEKPKKTVNGDYAITKPDDASLLAETNHDAVVTEEQIVLDDTLLPDGPKNPRPGGPGGNQ